MVEPLLQTALEVQAIARVHRIGQFRETTVFQYLIPETVDERIALYTLRRKGHALFSKDQDTSALHAAAPQPVGASSESKLSMTLRKNTKLTMHPDDMANILFNESEYEMLQRILLAQAQSGREAEAPEEDGQEYEMVLDG